MAKIKVMNVITDSNIAGAGNVLLTTLSCYNRDKLDLSVVLPRGSKLIEPVGNLGTRCIEMDFIAESSFSRKAIMPLLKLFKEDKPDIVHTHASMSARIAARLYGKCGIVYTRHSVFDNKPQNTRFPRKQVLGAVNNSLSDVIIAVSPAAKSNIVETGANPDKIKVVFNGVSPVKPFSEAEKLKTLAKFRLNRDNFICAIIARLEMVKGHEFILGAAKMLIDKDPSVRIVIAGSGSQESELRAKAQKLMLSNCIFLGFVKEIHEIENIMHLQLNASYGTEATSLSLLEGMSLGVPAIVSDFGGNPYVIENGRNGIVVPMKDSAAICDAILKLKNDGRLYSGMSRNAKQIFNTRFTSECMARDIEDIYSGLYERKHNK